MRDLTISEIQIVPIRSQNGLVAFASCVIENSFYLGNIAVYSSPSSVNGFRLVFPNKKLASGQIVDCFHPVSKSAGEQVTAAIVSKYVDLMDNFHHVN